MYVSVANEKYVLDQCNEKLSLMATWSSSVSIYCFKIQGCIGHLVWFFLLRNLNSFWSELLVSLQCKIRNWWQNVIYVLVGLPTYVVVKGGTTIQNLSRSGSPYS